MAKALAMNTHVKDTLTEFAGVVIGRCVYRDDTPDVRVLSDQLDEDGKPVSIWMTESRFVAD